MPTTTPPTPLINWHALGQILATSVVLFSVGVYPLSAFRRADATVGLRSANAVLIALITLTILATGVWGFYLIIHK